MSHSTHNNKSKKTTPWLQTPPLNQLSPVYCTSEMTKPKHNPNNYVDNNNNDGGVLLNLTNDDILAMRREYQKSKTRHILNPNGRIIATSPSPNTIVTPTPIDVTNFSNKIVEKKEVRRAINHATMQEFIKLQSKFAFDPIGWAHRLLNFTPDTWQAEGLTDFVDHKFCAWSTGSGVGKSCLLAVIVLFFLFNRPFPKVPCTAPSKHQLEDVLWAEIRRWMRQSELIRKLFVWTATTVYLKGEPGEWFAVARTARANPNDTATEGLQGFHAENICFVVDEATGVPDSIMAAVDGALTTRGAHAVLASNPTRRSGYFYKITNEPDLAGVFAVKFINSETAKYADKAAIDRAIKLYGKDSIYYRVKILGLPPLADSDALITPEQIEEAHNRRFEKTDSDSYYLSLDPARYGDDFSVFYVRRNMSFIARHELQGQDASAVIKVALDLFDLYDPAAFAIDTIGMGAGIYDVARKMVGATKKNRIIDVHVGKDASEPDKFHNLRAEIYWLIKEHIDKISIEIPTEKLDEELTSIHYGWNKKDTKIQLESKDDIRRVLGRSPDDADSFVLNLYPTLRKLKSGHVSPKFFTTIPQKRSIFSLLEGDSGDSGVEKKETKLIDIGAKTSFYSSSRFSSDQSNPKNYGRRRFFNEY